MEPQTTPRQHNALIVLALIVLAILLLAQPAHADGPSLTDGIPAPYLDPDQLHAAQVAAGEAPASLLGLGTYGDVLCVIQNRKRSGQFPNELGQVMRQGFYAPPRPLTPAEYNLAVAILALDNDCGGQWLYVLSLQDVATHDLPQGDWTSPTVTLDSGKKLGLVFYESSPWGR